MLVSLTNKKVIIRKEHRCFSCLRRFPIKTNMMYWSCIYDGDFNNGYTCITCEEIMNKCKDDAEDGYPEGFVFEMLNENETPEERLANWDKIYQDSYKK